MKRVIFLTVILDKMEYCFPRIHEDSSRAFQNNNNCFRDKIHFIKHYTFLYIVYNSVI